MQPNRSRLTDKAWADTFGRALHTSKQPQGEGWMTFPEIKARFKIGANKAHVILCRMVRQGQMKRFRGLQTKGNRAVAQIWYRPMALRVKTP